MILISMASVVLSAAMTVPRNPRDEELVFDRASALVPWCRREVEAYFVAKGVPTYQMNTSHKSEGRMLIVEGKVRAGGQDVPFTCRVAQGGLERYAVAEISG